MNRSFRLGGLPSAGLDIHMSDGKYSMQNPFDLSTAAGFSLRSRNWATPSFSGFLCNRVDCLVCNFIGLLQVQDYSCKSIPNQG